MSGAEVVEDEFVGDGLIAINVSYVGSSDYGDARLGKFCADGTKSGQGEDGVTDPIRSSDHKVHATEAPAKSFS